MSIYIEIDSTRNYFTIYFHWKLYKNAKIVNFVYCGKTRTNTPFQGNLTVIVSQIANMNKKIQQQNCFAMEI